MDLMKKLVKDSLKQNRQRSRMTAVGIALSVALIVVVTTMVSSLRASLRRIMVDSYGDYHVLLRTDDRMADLLATNREVKDLRHYQLLGYLWAETEDSYKPYLKILTMEEGVEEDFGLRLLEGKFPENSSELVVSCQLIENMKDPYLLGGEISADLLERGLPEGRAGEDEQIPLTGTYLEGERVRVVSPVSYRIVGIIDSPGFGMEGWDDAGYTAVTRMASGQRALADFAFYKLDNPDRLEDHLRALYTADEEGGTYSFLDSPVSVNWSLIRTEGAGLSDPTIIMVYTLAAILLLMILLTAVMVIRNLFTISVVEKTRQYGMLKSLGATDQQIRSAIIYEGFLLGLPATVIGTAVGLSVNYLLILLINRSFFAGKEYLSELVMAPSLPGLLVALALSAITIYLSSRLSAKRLVGLSPLEAIRSTADIKVNRRVKKEPAWIDRFFGIHGLISYKNFQRDRKKYSATVRSLAFSLVLFLVVSSFVDQVTTYLNRSIEFSECNLRHRKYNGGGDIEKGSREFEEDFIGSRRLADRFFEGMDYCIFKTGEFRLSIDELTDEYLEAHPRLRDRERLEEQFPIHFLDASSFQMLLDRNGLGDEEAVDFLLLNREERATGPRGRESEPISYPAIRRDRLSSLPIIIESLQNKLAQFEGEDQGGDMERSVQETVSVTEIAKGPIGFGRTNQQADGVQLFTIASPDRTGMYLSDSGWFANAEDSFGLRDEIFDYMAGQGYPDYNIYNSDETIGDLKNIILVVQIFAYGFIAVIVLISTTNIINTIRTNVLLRRREFASLRSMGLTDRDFDRISRWEAFYLGAKALARGIPIGLVLSYLIYRVFRLAVETTYVFPWKGILAGTVFIMIILQLIMRAFTGSIKKANIIETIRSENI